MTGRFTIHLNGEDVQLIPIHAAHTDGDTLVRFTAHDSLATGDYFRSGPADIRAISQMAVC
jgi:cyclase